MISIITPVLNGEKFIRENINSIMQFDVPFEHIIVDGGSTDATLEIVKEFPHLILVNQNSKTGLYGAIDQGFKLAKYDYIYWLNCDDVVIPKTFVKVLKNAYLENIDFVYGNSDFNWVNENKITFQKANPFAKYFLKKGIMPFVQPSSFYKKELLDRVQINFEKYKIIGDLDFFIQIASLDDVKFWYCREKLSVFLKYGGSLGDLNHDVYLKERCLLSAKESWLSKILFKLTLKF